MPRDGNDRRAGEERAEFVIDRFKQGVLLEGGAPASQLNSAAMSTTVSKSMDWLTVAITPMPTRP
jgi:hypothetical protein